MLRGLWCCRPGPILLKLWLCEMASEAVADRKEQCLSSLKIKGMEGRLVAQLLKHLTLRFISGHAFRVLGSSLVVGFASVGDSLSMRLHVHSLTISLSL